MPWEESEEGSPRCREAGESLREWREDIEQYKLLPILEQIERITHGERGERLVGAVLEELREDGYRVVHAILCARGDIDHVLVGPAGVCVIETKHPRSNGLITFRNGQGMFVGGRPKWNAAIKQAKNGARKIDSIVKKHCATEGAMPIVVFAGNWRVADQWESTDVRVFTPVAFQDYIREQQPVLTRAEISAIASDLESFSER